MKKNITIILFVFSLHVSAQVWVNPSNAPGTCMRNVYDDLVPGFREDLNRAVFKYSNGIGSCTGTLINRNTNGKDLGQYFITSWHCFKTGSTCGGSEFNFNNTITLQFNFQSPPDHLGQVIQDNNNGQLYSITRNIRLVDRVDCAYGDVAICEILGAPIPPHFNPYFVGWLPSSPISPLITGSFFTLGHPNKSTKQAAATNNLHDGITGSAPSQVCNTTTKIIDFVLGWIWKRKFSTSVICQYVQIPFTDTRYVAYGYTYGDTEGGQSGSGLFEGNNRLIGNLSGTPIGGGCTSIDDFYGKFYSYYSRQTIKNTLNPSNNWHVDINGIPGRNKDCYEFIDYNYGPNNYLYPAKYYQENNAIILNSNSFIKMGYSNNDVTVMSQSDFTLNAGSYIDFGPGFTVEQGANFKANSGVPCGYSGNYRIADDSSDYESQARQELYARVNTIYIPDHLELNATINELNLTVQVFPNPTTDILHVALFSVPDNTIKVSVYNMLGTQIYSNSFNYEGQKEIAIPISDIENGVYEIVFTSGNYKDSKKLVVQK